MGNEIDDTMRLDALMLHPDKFWIDGSSGAKRFSGDGEKWHEDPRFAVDDLIWWLNAQRLSQAA